jgi:phage tail-like protein
MPTPSKIVHFVTLDVPNITQNATFVGVFRQMTGLEVSFEVLEYAEGGNNDFVHHLPGRVHYPNLVLSWGMTFDDLLQQWFFKTHVQAELQPVTLTLHTMKGDVSKDVRKFTFSDAYPVKWSGPNLANDNSDLWSETLEIAHSGMSLT